MDTTTMRKFITAAVIVAFITLLVSSLLFAAMLGDWVARYTEIGLAGWIAGGFVYLGSTISLGMGIGIFFWYRSDWKETTLPSAGPHRIVTTEEIATVRGDSDDSGTL